MLEPAANSGQTAGFTRKGGFALGHLDLGRGQFFDIGMSDTKGGIEPQGFGQGILGAGNAQICQNHLVAGLD